MDLLQTIETSIIASLWFSWIALLVACVPTAIATISAPGGRKLKYFIAGLFGGVGGEFCAVHSTFLSIWIWCQSQHPCNDAQGGIILIFLIPVETFVGSLLATAFMWLTLRVSGAGSSTSQRTVWTCSILVQLTVLVLATWLLAHLMA